MADMVLGGGRVAAAVSGRRRRRFAVGIRRGAGGKGKGGQECKQGAQGIFLNYRIV